MESKCYSCKELIENPIDINSEKCVDCYKNICLECIENNDKMKFNCEKDYLCFKCYLNYEKCSGCNDYFSPDIDDKCYSCSKYLCLCCYSILNESVFYGYFSFCGECVSKICEIGFHCDKNILTKIPKVNEIDNTLFVEGIGNTSEWFKYNHFKWNSNLSLWIIETKNYDLNKFINDFEKKFHKKILDKTKLLKFIHNKSDSI